MEQVTLRLSGDRSEICKLSPDGLVLNQLLATLRSVDHPEGRMLRLQTPEGRGLDVAAKEIVGVELPPPHCLVRDFLSAEEQARAMDWVTARADKFESATISLPSTQHQSAPEYDLRRSRVLNDVVELIGMVMPKLQALMPKLWPQMHLPNVPIKTLEGQVTAHRDGDFFNTHTDNGLPDIAHRFVSWVCYFHKEPKRFTGGHLRFYNTLVQNGGASCGAPSADIDPPGNSLIVFPSVLYHEVTPIQCASTVLTDQRLTINGWLCR